MACRWRIRHKLLLAHGLVVLIVLLLLGGTLYGLASYRTTRRAFDKKIVELELAGKFQVAVKALAQPDSPNDPQLIGRRIDDARAALAAYDAKIQESTAGGQDIPYADHERGIVVEMHKHFVALEGVLREPPGHVGEASSRPPLILDPVFKKHVDALQLGAADLNDKIYSDLYGRILQGAQQDYELCMYFVLSITGAGVVLMCGSLRFFYRWIFYPIRDLQLGVQQVAKGDFKHEIRIQSSDEIQDLAAAFNHMTSQLDAMYSDLARQVNERSRQLVRSERLASVGFLAAGVAHEINNPLASIVFCSEALERRILDMLAQIPPSATAAEESKVITKYLKMIQDESLRCKEITSRLLEFSRGGEKRREPTDMGELVQGVLDMVQHLQSRKGKEVIFNPGRRIVALVNAQEIKSVVVNLVVNALDSMDDGGTLSIDLELDDGAVVLTFRDTGCGMTPEVLENIFEPFYTRSRTGKGTGLGLSICHRIISQHQGEIEAASGGPDQGSTFTVRLPLQPADDGSGAEPRRPGRETLSTEHSSPHLGRKAA